MVLNIIHFNRKEAKQISDHKLWSDSKTKEVLTEYAEGLAIKRFDSQEYYNVRLRNRNPYQWLVMDNTIGNIGPQTYNPNKKEHPLMLDRCCLVIISGGYINCNCGDTNQSLMPC